MSTRGISLSALRPIWLGRLDIFNLRTGILLLTTATVIYLVLGPIIIAAMTTFKPRGTLPFEPGPLTLENYAHVFLDTATWSLMLNTAMFAAGSLVVGMGLAIVLGWLVERSDIPHRDLMFALVIAPMAIPGMMAAIAWIFLLHPNIGIVNTVLRGVLGLETTQGPLNIYTLWGMIFVEGIRMVPTIFLMISGAFRGMDPALEEASRVAGRPPMATTVRITLPLMWPALLAALLYFAIRAIEVFEIPGILGMNAGIHVFSTRIYWAIHHPSGGLPDYGLASTLSLIVVAISLLLIWLYYRSTKRSYKFATVTGKGFRPHRVKLGWWKHPAMLICTFYFLVALVFPFFILLWTSLHKFYLPPSWSGLSTITLDSYVELVRYGGIGRAIVNTLLLALLTGTVTMLISFFVGWFVVRSRSGLTRVLDVISFLPHSIPTIVIALGVMLMYLSFRNPFYGTIVVISIALTVSFLAYGSRVMAAGMLQIHPELEEASRVAGGGWIRTYWRIILPLVGPAFINGWIWVAVHAGRELTAALMLYTPSSTVISTSIWNMWEQGKESLASALAVILILVLITINWAGRMVLGRMRSF